MAITNMVDLRKALCECLEQVRGDRRYVVQATEVTNAAGKIINSLRVELEYYKLAKSNPPPIPFIVGDANTSKK